MCYNTRYVKICIFTNTMFSSVDSNVLLADTAILDMSRFVFLPIPCFLKKIAMCYNTRYVKICICTNTMLSSVDSNVLLADTNIFILDMLRLVNINPMFSSEDSNVLLADTTILDMSRFVFLPIPCFLKKIAMCYNTRYVKICICTNTMLSSVDSNVLLADTAILDIYVKICIFTNTMLSSVDSN